MGCAPTLRMWEQNRLSICAGVFILYVVTGACVNNIQILYVVTQLRFARSHQWPRNFIYESSRAHSEAPFSCQIDSEHRENDVTRTKYTPSHPIRSHLFTLRKSIFLPSSFGERKINKSFSDVILSIECIQAVKIFK